MTAEPIPLRPDIRADIGICTFRRPEVTDALMSLAEMAVPDGVIVRVIVADNDRTPSAFERIDALRDGYPFEIVYVHCPASNISIARNACLDHSHGDFLAFVDDDETVTAKWLAELLQTAKRTSADVVLGPVRACYRDDAPDWMRRGDFHSTNPVWVGDDIVTGYTCNVLLRRSSAAFAERRFKLALGRTGGEDTEFFSKMHQDGATFAFAANAWVFETVPVDRARFSWLARRRFRSGQTHGRLLAEKGTGPRRLTDLAIATTKIIYCLIVCGIFLFFPAKRNRSALRAVLHAGAVSGLLGRREIEIYGAREPRS